PDPPTPRWTGEGRDGGGPARTAARSLSSAGHRGPALVGARLCGERRRSAASRWPQDRPRKKSPPPTRWTASWKLGDSVMRALATRGRGALTVALALTGWATGASASLMSARLRWQPSPAFGVVGYRVYMRTLSGSYGPPPRPPRPPPPRPRRERRPPRRRRPRPPRRPPPFRGTAATRPSSPRRAEPSAARRAGRVCWRAAAAAQATRRSGSSSGRRRS